MTDYGVQPTGYVRKPLSVILAELEAKMVTEFGPGVIQSPKSPFGQLNGLMSDLLAEIDEHNLDIYQSYDPNQAEGTRLEMLANIRLLKRNSLNDDGYRKAITNEGYAQVDIQDLSNALRAIEGVTFAHVFLNETGEVTDYQLERGTVAVAIMGGDDDEIARVMRRYIVPGINTYGNGYVSSTVNGYCRAMAIIRPIEINVNVEVRVRLKADSFGCPPPSTLAIKRLLEDEWLNTRLNGTDPGYYTVRSIIERAFTNVEVVSIQGVRDEIDFGLNNDVPIGFIEIAKVTAEVLPA